MTTLTITPKYGDKTARFKGTVAAGEHVAVTIVGAAGWKSDTLRLRVLGQRGETLAQFQKDAEADIDWSISGSDLSCELNLNTVQMLAAVPVAAALPFLFVLDDGDESTLYFKDFCEVTHWPNRLSEETPENAGGSKYVLPVASASILGGVKVGANLSIDAEGVLSASAQTVVDSALSAISENPVQNKVVKAALDANALGHSYALVSPQPSSGTVQLVDRAVNAVAPIVTAVGHWMWSDGVQRPDPVLVDGGDPEYPIYADFGDWDFAGAYAGSGEMTVDYFKGITRDFSVVSVEGDYSMTLSYDGCTYEAGLWTDGETFWQIEVYVDDVMFNMYSDDGTSIPSVGDTVTLSGDVYLVATGYTTYESDVSSLVLPPAVSGKARDFLVRLAVPANFTFSWPALPSGGAYETAGGTMPDVSAEGTYLVSFTETAPNKFAVSAKPLEEVAE